MSRKFYRVREAGDGASHLTDDPRGAYVSREPVRLAELDSYDIVDYLDGEAEQENYHHLVGVHAALARLVRKHAGDQEADDVMRDVLKAGGLRRLGERHR